MDRSSKIVFLSAGLCASILWSYWTVLGELIARWTRDPQYSHGYLVPVFAGALLWLRRKKVDLASLRPTWSGLLLILLATVLRLAGAYYSFDWLDAVSLLPCLAGLCALVGGSAALRWSWPAIAFLFFMIPLPYQAEVALANPLQRIATRGSTYVLQTCGLPALADGNRIRIDDLRIEVAQACNGLSMLITFFALSAAVALVIQRPFWERALIVASAVPLALVVNVCRVAGTALLHGLVGSQVAQAFFHDFAGWLMMPLALVMLWAELRVLSFILVAPAPATRRGVGAEKVDAGGRIALVVDV